jgi:hypothetical protein
MVANRRARPLALSGRSLRRDRYVPTGSHRPGFILRRHPPPPFVRERDKAARVVRSGSIRGPVLSTIVSWLASRYAACSAWSAGHTRRRRRLAAKQEEKRSDFCAFCIGAADDTLRRRPPPVRSCGLEGVLEAREPDDLGPCRPPSVHHHPLPTPPPPPPPRQHHLHPLRPSTPSPLCRNRPSLRITPGVGSAPSCLLLGPGERDCGQGGGGRAVGRTWMKRDAHGAALTARKWVHGKGEMG